MKFLIHYILLFTLSPFVKDPISSVLHAKDLIFTWQTSFCFPPFSSTLFISNNTRSAMFGSHSRESHYLHKFALNFTIESWLCSEVECKSTIRGAAAVMLSSGNETCVCVMLSACYFHSPLDVICISKELHSHRCKVLAAAENDIIQKLIHPRLKPRKTASPLHFSTARKMRVIQSNGFLKLPLHQRECQGGWVASHQDAAAARFSQLNRNLLLFNTSVTTHTSSNAGYRHGDYHLTRSQRACTRWHTRSLNS